MAPILVEGFELGDQLQDVIQQSNAGTPVSTAHPLPGGWSRYALKWGVTNGFIQRFKATAGEVYFHVHHYDDTATSRSWRFYLGNGDGFNAVRIGANSSGQLTIADAAGTTRATGTTLIDAGVYHCYQVHAIMGNTGTVEVRLDGLSTLEASASGFDFQPGSLTTFDRWATHAATTTTMYYDDVVCYDTTGTHWNTWTGCVGVQGLRIIGDGDDEDWLPTEGDWDTVVGGHSPYVWFKLDETSGTTADNAEGTAARDGTYEGSVAINQTGKDGIRSGDKAVLFDGTNDDVLLSSGALDIATATTAWSMEFWYKSSQAASGAIPIVAGRKNGDGNPLNAVYMDNGGQRLRWDTRGTGGSGLNQLQTTVLTLVNDGEWHHVVLTHSTGKVKHIYIDGVDRASATHGSTTGMSGLDWSYIGRDRTNATWFTGSLSEVVVYQGLELSQAQVTESYLAGLLKWELVDEFPSDGDTTYIYSETTDDVQSFQVEPLTSIYSPEGPMNVQARVKKTEPGARAVQLGYKTTGSNHFSPDKGMGLGAYQAVSHLFPIDDEDGDPFSDVDLADIDVAIKTT